MCKNHLKVKASVTTAKGLHRRNILKWPDATVYYDVDPFMPEDIIDVIDVAVQYMNSLTCVQWVQRYPWADDVRNYVTFDYNYNEIYLKSQCSSNLQIIGGQQQISIGSICWRENLGNVLYQRRTILHEMMHTLGFTHEHERPDRDCYVRISSTLPAWIRRMFDIVPRSAYWIDDYPYDYNSVIHYITGVGIVALNKSITTLGRSDGTISPSDIKKIEYVYCGAPSFCGVQGNVQTCRDIWQAKVNSNCSNWSGWDPKYNFTLLP